MIETLKDKKRWNQQLALVEQLDFYHTYDYHRIPKSPSEIAILTKYTDNVNSLLLPLLIRDIENSDYKNAISVYGYAGILTSHLNEGFNKKKFLNELHSFFAENKIITVFSILHPFIENQASLFEGLGNVNTWQSALY